MTTLQQMAENQANAHVLLNDLVESLSAAGIFSLDQDETGGLVWGYYGGRYNGNTVADGTVTLTDNATNYLVVLRSSGVVSVSTATTHSTDPLYARLYKVTTVSGAVTAVVDERWETNGLFLAPTASSTSLASDIHAATGKTTPVDADEMPLADSAASYGLKKVTWANVKATLKTYFDALYQPLATALTALAALTPAASKIPYFTGSSSAGLLDLDTDGTLAANSDTRVATQKATKTYVDSIVTGGASDVMIFKGVIDCSANPNYPAADAGNLYKISVAGKIGGASGPNVEAGDTIYCITDSTASGTQAGVGANWVISQVNVDGAVIGPASSTDNHVAIFSGTTGKIIADSGLTLSGTNTGDETTTTAGALINGATSKTTPVDADYLGLMDSAASNVLKKLSWANLKATLKTYFDTLYAAAGSSGGGGDAMNGRLTLQSGVPVPVSDQTAKTTIYFTPYKGNQITLWDGSAWTTYTFSELSLSIGTVAAFSAWDVFCYQNSGTPTLESLEWLNATVTMTIASPCVVTWNSHGMSNGDPVVFTTSGALPTGVSANTRYYAAQVAGNSLKLSTTPDDTSTYVNSSGSQSGTHTGHQSRQRGTQITYQDGRLCKSGDKTRRFIGSYLTDSTTTTQCSVGGDTTQVGGKWFLSNHYNRVRRDLKYKDTTATWSYTTGSYRLANGVGGNMIEYFSCYNEDSVEANLMAIASLTSNSARTAKVSIAVDSQITPYQFIHGGYVTSSSNAYSPMHVQYSQMAGVGYHFLNWIELGADGSCVFVGANGHQTGMRASFFH